MLFVHKNGKKLTKEEIDTDFFFIHEWFRNEEPMNEKLRVQENQEKTAYKLLMELHFALAGIDDYS